MTAGDSARPGVPSAAAGVGAYQDISLRPSERPPIGTVEGRPADPVRAEDFRRPYIEAGHAVQSPANAPGLASQSAPVSELAMTTVEAAVTTTPIETLEDALDYLAPKHCGACGESLDLREPLRGLRDAAEGDTPGTGRAAARRAGPHRRIERERQDAEAVAEARRLRAEAAERLAEAERLLRAADATDYRAVLRRRRDAAEGAFQAAVGMRQQLAAEFAQAVVDEEAAHEPLTLTRSPSTRRRRKRRRRPGACAPAR